MPRALKTETPSVVKASGRGRLPCKAGGCERGARLNPWQLEGRGVTVFWKDDLAWYRGRVGKYNEETQEHAIIYDDGQSELLHMDEEIWRLACYGKQEGQEKLQEKGETAASSMAISERAKVPPAHKDKPKEQPKSTQAHAVQKVDQQRAKEPSAQQSAIPGLASNLNEEPAVKKPRKDLVDHDQLVAAANTALPEGLTPASLAPDRHLPIQILQHAESSKPIASNGTFTVCQVDHGHMTAYELVCQFQPEQSAAMRVACTNIDSRFALVHICGKHDDQTSAKDRSMVFLLPGQIDMRKPLTCLADTAGSLKLHLPCM